MKSQFDHNLLSSFYLWFEAVLNRSSNGCYFTNLQNTFQLITDPDIPSSLYVYQGEFRQLVADNGVDVVNSGIFVDGNFVPSDSAGVYINYEDGRVLMPTASGNNLSITANSTVKELNTYISHEDEAEIIIHSDFLEQGKTLQYFNDKNTDNDKEVFFLPACFITLVSGNNEEFCFGGEEESKNRIRVMIIDKSPDNYIIDGAFSIFKDTARETINMLDFEDYPYGIYGSVKSPPYTYTDYIAANKNGVETWVDDVKCSRVSSDAVKKKMGAGYKIGFMEFDLTTRRFPRL